MNMPQPSDINVIWNNLINYHSKDRTIEDSHKSINVLAESDSSYIKLKEVFDAAETDLDSRILRNAYYNGINLSIVPVNMVSISNGNIYQNNKDYFSHTKPINDLVSRIDERLKNKRYYFA